MKNGHRIFGLLCTAVFTAACFFSCSTEADDNGGQGNKPTTASYKVEHYQQKLPAAGQTEAGYDLVENDIQVLTGKIGEKTEASAKTYTGFTAKSFEQETVTADGKTTVKIYYDRNTITLTIDLAGGTTTTALTGGKLTGLYGAPVTIAQPEKTDCALLGWNQENGKLPETFTVTGTYKAIWAKNAASYTVKHLLQNVDGNGYTEDESARQTKTTEAGAQTEAASKTYDGFTAQSFTQTTVAGNGSTVVEIKYNRNTITLTIDLAGGTTTTALTDGKLTGLYGAPVTIAQPERDDYNFIGWTPALPETFPLENASFTAAWISSSMTGAGINVTIQENPEIHIVSAVQSTGKVTLTAEDGFTNYKWYVNGFNDVQGTARVFELNTANLTGGTYTVTVRAEKNGITLSTIAAVTLDKTAPAKVTNLRITSVNTSTNKVSLAWTNPSDSDFAKAKIYWTESNGEHTKEVTGTAGAAASADVSVSNAANSYEFKVKTVDEFGNESSSKYVSSTMVMKVVSDGTFDLSSKERWSVVLTGFNVAVTNVPFKFKFKFSNPAGKVGDMYVRTNKTEYLYYGIKNGATLTALSGDWAGWYEVTGTLSSTDNTRFEIAFNGSAGVFNSNDALYLADFNYGDAVLKNSTLGAGKRSDITPVKSYVTLSDAN